MYTIGRFASIGRVTVRMLRHWDETGLLAPAHVDPVTGYRSYASEQLADLAEIVRLRDLGLGLVDVGRVLRAGADSRAARSVLESAREALRRSLAADAERLARFDAYLRQEEGAGPMSDPTTIVEFRSAPAQRVATLTRTAAGFGSSNIGPVVGPMFPEVQARLDAAGVAFGPAVAVYSADESGDGSGVLVTAGFEIGDAAPPVAGLDVHVLPAVEAAITTHHGSMDTIDESWMALVDQVKARGAVLSDACREIYLTPGDRPQEEWVTRLVQPVAAGA
ncbi:MerR family transcriptional regulator [Amnibacterium sp.]|uniref:MerR family transcriptional regulator n=1 Tax=Amnibacterium sp. TaxID=1872496 RepID=UPI0026070F8A|nr:MerR family transcriptional regulator [Amnibacterium sp.]MCU1474098.1 MerR family transcriptional regulator [Amnibacterium sp.]